MLEELVKSISAGVESLVNHSITVKTLRKEGAEKYYNEKLGVPKNKDDWKKHLEIAQQDGDRIDSVSEKLQVISSIAAGVAIVGYFAITKFFGTTSDPFVDVLQNWSNPVHPSKGVILAVGVAGMGTVYSFYVVKANSQIDIYFLKCEEKLEEYKVKIMTGANVS